MTLYCTVCAGDRVHPTEAPLDLRYPRGHCRDCDKNVIAVTSQDAARALVKDRERRRLERKADRRAAR